MSDIEIEYAASCMLHSAWMHEHIWVITLIGHIAHSSDIVMYIVMLPRGMFLHAPWLYLKNVGYSHPET